MRAIDTNVLVRLVTRDDARQVAAAEAFVASGAWVSHLVLAEATWVLTSVYDRGPREVATAVDMLLNHEHLTLQDPDVIVQRLHIFAGDLRWASQTASCSKSPGRPVTCRWARSTATWRGSTAPSACKSPIAHRPSPALRACANMAP